MFNSIDLQLPYLVTCSIFLLFSENYTEIYKKLSGNSDFCSLLENLKNVIISIKFCVFAPNSSVSISFHLFFEFLVFKFLWFFAVLRFFFRKKEEQIKSVAMSKND